MLNTKIKPLEHLLTREMNRREFLIYIGVIVLAVSGISRIYSTLISSHTVAQTKTSSGFGSGTYGGKAQS